MAALAHIIHASAPIRPLGESELLQLLANARSNNSALGVTGMLIHCDGGFFEVLEKGVEALFQGHLFAARGFECLPEIHRPLPVRG